MNEPIDLGKPLMDPCCVPTSPGLEKDSPKTYYPPLYIDGDHKLIEGIPESGTMTIKFERTSRTVSSRGEKTTVSVALDVQQILSVVPDNDEGEDGAPTGGDAIDALAKMLLNKMGADE